MVEKADSREAINERVALFIDVDNVLILAQNSGLPFHLHLIIDRVRQQGAIMSSKAYADWTSSLLKPVLSDFRANAIELVQLPTWHTGKRIRTPQTSSWQLMPWKWCSHPCLPTPS